MTATHPAIVTVSRGAPLEVHEYPTPTPVRNEVRVLVEWTASTPLDLHQADGGLLVTHPQILGDGQTGTVVEVGPGATKLKIGDQVFGFSWRSAKEKTHQLYTVVPENLLARVPEGFRMQEVVTVPNNFVTAWNTLSRDLGFELPWPRTEGYRAIDAEEVVLVWGGSSSVGMYVLQVLKWFGYENVVTTASQAHHQRLKGYGAKMCFDYRKGNVVEEVLQFANEKGREVKFVVDCIGSLKGSVEPISRIVGKGARVSIMLPVIVKDTAEGGEAEYSMDVTTSANWRDGVEVVGARTHFYLQNEFFAEKLQPEIMPAALLKGIIEPNEQVIVEGKTMLERAEKALSILRSRGVSGSRLVWRIAEKSDRKEALNI